MARPDKSAAVAELVEDFRSAQATVLTEYRGLSVTSMKALRRSLGADTKYSVVKNTLTKIAAKNAGVEISDDLLAGPSAVALPNNAFLVTVNSSTIQVNQPSHGKTTADTVKFQNLTVVNSFLTSSGFQQSVLTTSTGYSITVVNLDNYSFNASSGTGSLTTTIGGGSATAETI